MTVKPRSFIEAIRELFDDPNRVLAFAVFVLILLSIGVIVQ